MASPMVYLVTRRSCSKATLLMTLLRFQRPTTTLTTVARTEKGRLPESTIMAMARPTMIVRQMLRMIQAGQWVTAWCLIAHKAMVDATVIAATRPALCAGTRPMCGLTFAAVAPHR